MGEVHVVGGICDIYHGTTIYRSIAGVEKVGEIQVIVIVAAGHEANCPLGIISIFVLTIEFVEIEGEGKGLSLCLCCQSRQVLWTCKFTYFFQEATRSVDAWLEIVLSTFVSATRKAEFKINLAMLRKDEDTRNDASRQNGDYKKRYVLFLIYAPYAPYVFFNTSGQRYVLPSESGQSP